MDVDVCVCVCVLACSCNWFGIGYCLRGDVSLTGYKEHEPCVLHTAIKRLETFAQRTMQCVCERD